MTSYVAGFAFDQSREHLVLIEKLKPLWQMGKLNGVGGKIEPAESPEMAMAREFREETGVEQSKDAWTLFAVLSGYRDGYLDYRVYFYRTILTAEQFSSARTVELERIVKVDVSGILKGVSFPMVRNLRLLVALALDESGIKLPVSLFEDLNRENRG